LLKERVIKTARMHLAYGASSTKPAWQLLTVRSKRERPDCSSSADIPAHGALDPDRQRSSLIPTGRPEIRLSRSAQALSLACPIRAGAGRFPLGSLRCVPFQIHLP
jgi:hypothetical protein